jgi:hypothetical protein
MVYHRDTVLGCVTQVSGTARPQAQVELLRQETGVPYLPRTDETGLYVSVARLGDESAGETRHANR